MKEIEREKYPFARFRQCDSRARCMTPSRLLMKFLHNPKK